MVVGHFFVTGIEKSTREQTIDIKAIREDIIAEYYADHLIWEQWLPKAHLRLLDRETAFKRHVPTGSFVSDGRGATDVRIGLLIMTLPLRVLPLRVLPPRVLGESSVVSLLTFQLLSSV